MMNYYSLKKHIKSEFDKGARELYFSCYTRERNFYKYIVVMRREKDYFVRFAKDSIPHHHTFGNLLKKDLNKEIGEFSQEKLKEKGYIPNYEKYYLIYDLKEVSFFKRERVEDFMEWIDRVKDEKLIKEVIE